MVCDVIFFYIKLVLFVLWIIQLFEKDLKSIFEVGLLFYMAYT